MNGSPIFEGTCQVCGQDTWSLERHEEASHADLSGGSEPRVELNDGPAELVGSSHRAARADHTHDTSHSHPQFESLTWIKQDIRSHAGCLGALAVWCTILTGAVILLIPR